jgi:hypothetical protein
MYGNGAAIGIKIIRAVQVLAITPARAVFCVGAVGATTPGAAVSRIATSAAPAAVATTTVFGWFLSHDSVGGYRAMPASKSYEF